MDYKNLPYMLYADRDGIIYEHPYYRIAGFSGGSIAALEDEDLIRMPEFSKLFFIPDCPPIGLDPSTGECILVPEIEDAGVTKKCLAVASFPEPGIVRSHLPAVDYGNKSYILPMWGYTATGFRDDSYWLAGFRIEYNLKWDPRNYDDRVLIPAIREYQRMEISGPLVEHLINCAVNNHCFAAKNLFLKRWEAPLPISMGCNADCIGCLSLQPDNSCRSSHQRILFRPDKNEIVSIAVRHLDEAPEAIVSFGQGCEGEPLTEYLLMSESIREIRDRTRKGTINLNSNGSWPERVLEAAKSGLDSIRISLNSARPPFYRAYYRPKSYDFEDVITSISLSRELGLYTMINYLVFPGISDQEEEIEAMIKLLMRTGVNFVHMKNLNIDPDLYIRAMPVSDSKVVGMRKMVEIIQKELPGLRIGYFNQPVR